MKAKQGCGACSRNYKIIVGFNDAWTTRPDIAELMWDSEDGFRYSANSSKRVDFKCNKCGERIKDKVISNISKQGISCPRCSDGLSYPNKWMRSVAIELKKNIESSGKFKIDIKTEYQPEWAYVKEHEDDKLTGKKKYDIKITITNIDTNQVISFINEMHGLQHYKERGGRKFIRSLKQEQENDRLKRELNDKHENNIYSEIDSRLSDFDFIMNNFIDSNFKKELDKFIGFNCLEGFDLMKVRIECESSLVYDSCIYFNAGNRTVDEVAKIMELDRTTCARYLKRGTQIGWCDYDPDEEVRKGRSKSGKIKGKPIIRYSLNMEYIDEWESASEAARQLNLSLCGIFSVCNRKQKNTGGFIFRRKIDYEKYITQQQAQ